MAAVAGRPVGVVAPGWRRFHAAAIALACVSMVTMAMMGVAIVLLAALA